MSKNFAEYLKKDVTRIGLASAVGVGVLSFIGWRWMRGYIERFVPYKVILRDFSFLFQTYLNLVYELRF